MLFAIDLEHHLLPNVITLPGIVVGFLFSFITPPGWRSSLIGIVVGGGVLFLIAEGYYRVRHEEGLGHGRREDAGDDRRVPRLAAHAALADARVVCRARSSASALIATGRGTMKYALPFGTFLAIGAAVSAAVGQPILDWYFTLW